MIQVSEQLLSIAHDLQAHVAGEVLLHALLGNDKSNFHCTLKRRVVVGLELHATGELLQTGDASVRPQVGHVSAQMSQCGAIVGKHLLTGVARECLELAYDALLNWRQRGVLLHAYQLVLDVLDGLFLPLLEILAGCVVVDLHATASWSRVAAVKALHVLGIAELGVQVDLTVRTLLLVDAHAAKVRLWAAKDLALGTNDAAGGGFLR